MGITPESWQEAAGRKLRELADWLNRRRREDAPYVVYGTLAGLTLWPLVEAAARPDGRPGAGGVVVRCGLGRMGCSIRCLVRGAERLNFEWLGSD